MKKWFILALSFMVGLVLVACTDKTTTTTTATTSSTASTSTSSSTTTSTTTTTTTTTTNSTTTTTTEEPISTEVTVFIHLNMTLRAAENLNIKAWGRDLDGNWPTNGDYYVPFTGEDAYGIFAEIDLVEKQRSSLGFAIIPGTEFNPIIPQIDDIDFTEQDENAEIHIYMAEGLDSFTYGEPAAEVELIDISIGYVPTLPQMLGEETFKLFDDFVRPVIERTGVTFSGNVTLSDRISHLSVNYSSTTGINSEAAIYKAALGENTTGSYSNLVFVMKGSNGASINHLNLAFRYDDTHNLIVIPFTQLLDSDLQAMPELTNTYETYIISIPDTLDGKTFTGIGAATDVPAGGSMVGFHLYADGVNSGTVEIEEVYYTSSAITTGYNSQTDKLIDNFQRTNVNTVPAGIYWCGSVGEIVGKWLIMDATSGTAIYEDIAQTAETYENILITLRGSLAASDIYVTPMFMIADTPTPGTKVLLSTLLDEEGVAIGTFGTTFSTVVINLANNIWGSNLIGLNFELSSGIVMIDYIEFKTFAQGEITYPTIDVPSLLVWDDFERDSVGATVVYDAANPVALANDLYYIISYSDSVTKNQLAMDNGAIVFDCTTTTDYINFVESSHFLNDEAFKYMVFKMKVTDGGSYDHFRLQTKTSGVVWANTFLAAPGLSSFETPYVTNDGWEYIVVDLELSNIGTFIDELTLYYSDAGKLVIDSIFFANDQFTRLDIENRNVVDTVAGTQIFTAGDDYAYNHLSLANNNPDNMRYLVLLLKGTGMNNFRIQTYDGDVSGEVKYINQMIGIDAHEYLPEEILSDSYRYLAIDLLASGMQLNPDGIHLHLNNASVYIAEIFFADEVMDMYNPTELKTYEPSTPQVIDGSATGYVYTYIGFGGEAQADYLVMQVKGNLDSVRFATINGDESVVSGVVYLHDMIGVNGLKVAYEVNSDEYQTIVIDLAASGLGKNVAAMHFHYGDDSATDIMTIQKMYLVAKNPTIYIDSTSVVTLIEPVEPMVIDGSATGYVYNYIGLDAVTSGQKYLILTVKGSLESIRFQTINSDETQTSGVVYLNQMIGMNGELLQYKATSEEYQTLVIDLEASGLGLEVAALHFHYADDTATDILTIQKIEAGNLFSEILSSLETTLLD